MSSDKYAVIGHPIGHSLSPFIHEKLFELDNIKAQYVALDVADLDKEFDSTLQSLKGYNVTIPYKQDIIEKLDKVSDKAQLCGSVNTVKNAEFTTGYTTDGYGFVEAVKAQCGDLPKDVTIYGCGGASRAIAYECLLSGCELNFIVRKSSIDKCSVLKDEIKSKLGKIVGVYTDTQTHKIAHIGLLVNATPVGMHPNIDACVASDEIIKKADAVFDAVYNPLETLLLKKAVQYGKVAVGSVDMLVYQAAKAHEIWVGATYTDHDLQEICRLTKDRLR